jgi:tricorn protease
MLRMLLSLSLAATLVHAQDGPEPILYRDVTINATHVAFSYAGALWDVPRSGGTARRLSATAEDHATPLYSPDGSQLAFTRGMSVYVMPATGGEVRRLTWFPRMAFVRAWSPDSRTILFTSARDGDGNMRALTVPASGGPETLLPVHPVRFASFAPDGRRMAIVARTIFASGVDRRYYRGGMRDPIEIVDPRSGQSTAITRGAANVIFPMWVGGRIYFVNDSLGSFNLAVYDTATRRTRQLTNWRSYGITSASAGGGAVAFVRDGRLHIYDIATERLTTPPVIVPSDSSELAPRDVPVARFQNSLLPGPRGEWLAAESRGEVILVDAATGQGRNLSNAPASAEREPTLSPDGRSVAYFSDASGEYALHVRAADGSGSARVITLGDRPTYFRGIAWSPDARRVAFSDQRLVLWVADLSAGRASPVDSSRWIAQGLWQTHWAPDSRHLAYAKADHKGTRAVWIRDTQTGQAWQISRGGSDDRWPLFDPSGRWLYFASNSLAGLAPATDVWALLSSMQGEPLQQHRLMVTALRDGDVLPILPYGLGANPAAKQPAAGVLDLAHAADRVAMLSVPPRPVEEMWMSPAGALLVQVLAWGKTPFVDQRTSELLRVDVSLPRAQSVVTLGENLRGVQVSSDGSAALLIKRDGWALLPATGAAADAKAVDLSRATVRVEPRAEWRQIYAEAMRMMRDYFYDPAHHGVDMVTLERHFRNYLPNVKRRMELTDLLYYAFGEISVSHLGIGGGDMPRPNLPPPERIGVLGADIAIENGRYRLTRVLRNGEYQSENALTRAPLDQPGAVVRDGEYVFAIDSVPVTTDRPLETFLVGKAGRATVLRVGPTADGNGARDMTIVPAAGDNSLRRANWAAANRREVERRSNDRLAYVWIDGWSQDGVATLFRALSAYPNAEGLVVDERWNGGGITADAAVDALTREPLYEYMYRYGDGYSVPQHLIHGPKVLIIHEQNGSAAETFALMWKERNVGPVVGRATFGGGIGGALYYQPLVDGGRVTIPLRASFNSRLGEWGIENVGVEPDVRVPVTFADAVAGRDPQLQKAIDLALDALRTYRKPVTKRPAMPKHPPPAR